MAKKARRRTQADSTRRNAEKLGDKLEAFAEVHNLDRDAAHLIDQLEERARWIIDKINWTPPTKLKPGESITMPPALVAAREVLTCCEAARKGDVAAAIHAERNAWRMQWFWLGIDDALIHADKSFCRWRWTPIKCSPQQKAMLGCIGDAGSVDRETFIGQVWRDRPARGVIDNALSVLSCRVQDAGLRLCFRQSREQIVVRQIQNLTDGG